MEIGMWMGWANWIIGLIYHQVGHADELIGNLWIPCEFNGGRFEWKMDQVDKMGLSLSGCMYVS